MTDFFWIPITWIWIALDSNRILESVRERLKAEKTSLGVPAVSIYEAAVLSRKGRIDREIPMENWFDLAFADASLTLLPVMPEIAIGAAMLPEGFHGDSIDRILAATAQAHDLMLCTHDEKLLRFGQQGVYKFLEV